jgi:lipoprotein-releasing system permease protein
MAWGNVVGVGVVVLQHFTGLVRLDPEAYLLSAVPVEWGWDWWLGLNIATPIVLVALLSIPVAIVARIKPDQTLKFQ